MVSSLSVNCHRSRSLMAAAHRVWRGEHQNIYTMFCLPDWLNGVCAAFYLGTGFCAPYMYDDNGSPTNIFVKVRRIELFLSVLECIAVVGWLYQWYALFVTDLRLRPRQCRGRGWTFDDPDMWANISLVIAAIYYIIYNIVICVDNYKYYDTSTLYFWGDFWYLINAVCYIVCALRDCECFWFMPLSGHFPDFDAMANECGLLNVEDGFASTASVTPTADDEKVLENTASKGLLSRILARQRSGSGSGQSEMSSGSADIDEEAVTPLLTSGVEGKQRV